MKTGDLVRIKHANLPECNAVVIGTYFWGGGTDWEQLALELYAPALIGAKVKVLAKYVEMLSESR